MQAVKTTDELGTFKYFAIFVLECNPGRKLEPNVCIKSCFEKRPRNVGVYDINQDRYEQQ